ncbi:sensor histidine kinase [Chamaesiphon minutus]|uniref:histidine kinase n=1 Tax=Chamaesiphon minutus (strain ATCC 27169 / PCC 6605) TaxID=1173020 RepID=K9UEH6_CHAP6|nr:HAMP domain-containing sensor histidine kinase [Chamaesiphon minutus]AFY93522.1 signal transduction histidine kinase [Chamaesiphon minutus PCC 6605]
MKPIVNLLPNWLYFWGEARTRIVIWYILIVSIAIGGAIPLMRQQMLAQVDARVRADLNEEMQEFIELLSTGPRLEDLDIVKALQADGKVIPDGYPTTTQELASLLELHLKRRIPEDDTFLIGFVNGEFDRSSPRALPPELSRNSPLIKRLAKVNRAEQGELELTGSGELLYKSEPVKIKGKVLGVYVVAHTTQGEQAEALSIFNVIIQVKAISFGLALVMIWWAAGRVLAPLRGLSATAHAISESDLSKRLPTQGNGEIAKLSATFNEMMDRLELAFETQRNFINDAGHELRTPITIIQGHLELMGDDPQEREETIALVMDELARMTRLVEDLVLLSKSERVDFLRLERVDAAVLMQEMYLKATALSSDRDWRLENQAVRSILVDRQRITEAMMNLAENAVQHTVAGTIITLGSDLDRDKVLFWVRDAGEGIPAAEQKRIFERFARVTTNRRRSDGSGLGLAIVKAIVEAHHGSVNLQSNLGTGSTFTLVLPTNPAVDLSYTPVPHVQNSRRGR